MVVLKNLELPEIIRTAPTDTADDFREGCPVCGAKIQPDKLSSHIATKHSGSLQSGASSKVQEVNDQPIRRSNSKSPLANKPQPIIQVKPRKKIVLTKS